MAGFDAIIAGGGASGMFCAVQLAKRHKRVLLIEKNKIFGKKLLITGKGRCNVTNNCDPETVLKNVPRNPKFLYSAVNGFTPKDTMCFFENSGVSLKTERGCRVFPESDKSSDIVSALEREIDRAEKYIVKKNAGVSELIIHGGRVIGVRCGDKEYYADSVVIACGGKSYPKTGSDGDGYKFAESAGHTVVKTAPSLVPLETSESYVKELMGLSLKNVTLSIYKENSKKPVFSQLGEMLFTHFGISGPLVLSASSHMQDPDKIRYTAKIDLKPGLDEHALDARILRDFSQNPNRSFSNALSKLLPAKLIGVIIRLSEIPADKKVNSVTKDQRAALAGLLKGLELKIKGFRPIDEAVITRGGVCVKEIDPKTMQSKLISGLYFIGEVLDVDAYTGGFNLQIAFSTAYAAAQNI